MSRARAPIAAATPDALAAYWEDRAERFARRGDGLGAVCSYGMPGFYNRSIEWSQRLALGSWLEVEPGTRVLDAGCGVGRWSRRLASRGAEVTGVDLSAAMVAEAGKRAVAEGLGGRCRFVVGDLATLALGETFRLVVGVTVLQHILDPRRVARALARLRAHLDPDGRLVLLEAAPSRPVARCDSEIFRARTLDDYRALWTEAGFELQALRGVDPMPLKIWFLPYYSRLPRAVATALLGLSTGLSLPVDLILGRRLVRPSWHKLIVLSPGAGR